MTKQKNKSNCRFNRGLYRDYCIYRLHPTNFCQFTRQQGSTISAFIRSSILFNLGYLRMDKRTQRRIGY